MKANLFILICSLFLGMMISCEKEEFDEEFVKSNVAKDDTVKYLYDRVTLILNFPQTVFNQGENVSYEGSLYFSAARKGEVLNYRLRLYIPWTNPSASEEQEINIVSNRDVAGGFPGALLSGRTRTFSSANETAA